MGKVNRKPIQGVWNIIRFNWQFYALAVGLIIVLYIGTRYLGPSIEEFFLPLSLIIFGPMFISLVASAYVYDFSGLYKLRWLDGLGIRPGGSMININAGFDETSILLKEKFPQAELAVLDFYDPLKHTEVSIKRARKAYPPYPETQQVTTGKLPFADNSGNTIFIIFSAHEIRDEAERTVFFQELYRILKPGGKLIITEHLRDFPNFLAYNIGFFHFHARATWRTTFNKAALTLVREKKITPFVSTFLLEKNGNSL
jgi:ubiquinone/menaquinone biosynthesis C-methylase UbiE